MLVKIGISCQKYLTKLRSNSRNSNQVQEIALLQKKVNQLKTEYTNTANLELEKGTEIQGSFLPEELPQIDNLEIVAHFYPTRIPQGEFFTRKKFKQLGEEPVTYLSSLLEQIKSSLLFHIQDKPQFDDITLLAIRRKAGAAEIS